MIEPTPELNRQPSPEELVLAAQRQRWGGLSEELASEFDRASAQVRLRVFRALSDGSLTPEASLLAWQEVYALDKMRRRIVGKATEGLPPDPDADL